MHVDPYIDMYTDICYVPNVPKLIQISRSCGVLSVSHRYGDYPMLPNKSIHERDPWYQWDQPDVRRNWGEPVRTPATEFSISAAVTEWHYVGILTVLALLFLVQTHPQARGCYTQCRNSQK